jgi:coproporphyrinogen III oxidase
MECQGGDHGVEWFGGGADLLERKTPAGAAPHVPAARRRLLRSVIVIVAVLFDSLCAGR